MLRPSGCMDKIVVEGGSRLVGKIQISGAKNAALPLLAAALLPMGSSTFKNVPELADVRTMTKLLRMLGWEVDGTKTLTITAPEGKNRKKLKLEAPYELVKTMRASVLVLGPLLAIAASDLSFLRSTSFALPWSAAAFADFSLSRTR